MNEAELLFCETLGCQRADLYLDKGRALAPEQLRFISSALARRVRGEPLQYIMGKTEFMGLSFKVTPNVLIPRPETEILTEKIIELVTRSSFGSARDRQSHKATSILEIGTGSGCIAVSLAKYLTNVEVTAVDISPKAIELTRYNAALNKVAEKIKFSLGNLFTTYDLQLMTYDLIASNPPYIPSEEIDGLQPEVQYEPRAALDGGRDGLRFYRRIFREAPQFLKRGGFLILEMGAGQCRAIKKLCNDARNFEIIEVVRDYNNIERVLVAQN